MSNVMFKNIYTNESIKDLANRFQNYYSEFQSDKFIEKASKDLNKLEMKERINQIAVAIKDFLPQSYPNALSIVLSAMKKNKELEFNDIRGFLVWPLCQFVEDNGLDDFNISLDSLYEMTKHFTSEVPIRAFILKDANSVLDRMQLWVHDEDENVRRLVSEGLRPRLPWAQRLPVFMESPSPVIRLLEQLKNDPELYVRRSVANNLNDISKDNPDIVIDTVLVWSKDTSKEMKQLIKHGCRTLIKSGHPRIFPLLGFTKDPQVRVTGFKINSNNLVLGEDAVVEAQVVSESDEDQKIVIDYKLYLVKANGKLSPKVYKWTTLDVPARSTISIQKTHKLRAVTVRKYYSGEHHFEVLINGESKARLKFGLTINS